MRRILPLLLLLAGCNTSSLPFPKDLTTFQQIGDKPVFAGEAGKWDALIRERGWIVVDAGVWKLYYTGYDDPKGIRRLGLATSNDGLTWTRHPDNPLVKDQWIEDMTIVKDGDRYVMYCEGQDDHAQMFASTDGLAWKHAGELEIRETNGKAVPPPFGTPTVFKYGKEWRLLYERNDKGIWLASARVLGTRWDNVQEDPVMAPGPGEYDRDMIAVNQVIERDSVFYAFYHGCKNDPDKTKRRWGTCLAASRDLIHWTKFAGNPLVPLAENRSSGIVVPVDRGWRLYTMHPAVWAYEGR